MTVTVLVSGGLGYLGGRLLLHLRAAGHVRLRASTRRPPATTASWTEGIELVQAELTDAHALARACEGADAVIHLAALNAAAAAADPQSAIRINIDGTRLLLAAARQAGVRRFVYFSTAHVYGAPLEGDLDENTPAANPHPYAATHRRAEELVLSAPLRGLVFRLSNSFGAPADSSANCWALLVNDLCRQAATKGSLTLNGTGLETRDFVPLSDVVRAVSFFLDQSDAMWGNGLFNLASGATTTTLAMAERIAARVREVLGIIPSIAHRPIVSAPPRPFRIIISKLRAAGFEPRGDADKEIDATLRLCHQAFR